jgi:hypothetical protein
MLWCGKMPSYYRRQFELFVSDRAKPFIAATNERQFKVVFTVLLDFGGFNSYADIAVYNLSRSTENKVFKKYEYVGLRAGYENSIDYIFKGQIVNIIREKQGPNTITRLICKGGALIQDTSTINKSFEGGVTVVQLIQSLAEAMTLPLVINQDDFSSESDYISGYLLSGDPKKYLNKLSAAHSFDWIIENERLVVVKKSSFREGGVTIISARTGMVGVPEITEIGADVITRINPSYRIGGQFKIQSQFAQVNYSNIYFQDVPESIGQGTYKIQRIEYSGDSYGEVWDSKINGLSINL